MEFLQGRNIYAIGGYFSDQSSQPTCCLVQFGVTFSEHEVVILALEESIQFLLEEVEVKVEEISIISSSKDMLLW